MKTLQYRLGRVTALSLDTVKIWFTSMLGLQLSDAKSRQASECWWHMHFGTSKLRNVMRSFSDYWLRALVCVGVTAAEDGLRLLTSRSVLGQLWHITVPVPLR